MVLLVIMLYEEQDTISFIHSMMNRPSESDKNMKTEVAGTLL